MAPNKTDKKTKVLKTYFALQLYKKIKSAKQNKSVQIKADHVNLRTGDLKSEDVNVKKK